MGIYKNLKYRFDKFIKSSFNKFIVTNINQSINKCKHCNIFKQQKCPSCYGLGKIYSENLNSEICMNCGGSRYIPCVYCNGVFLI
jgi:DnaJ-class molecular chaperone